MGIGGGKGRPARPGEVIDGRYRLLGMLGEGGMGTVYLAEHTLIKRRVAVKVLHPELATDATLLERFMREARAAGTLGHPNIVESTDMGFGRDHVPYIVFEHLEGALLTDEIYRAGGLPVQRAVRIAQQIASALHAAHAAGIVHRDLKSDNVFLTAGDRVKVLDFGVSRFLDLEDKQAHVAIGTPEFMAPEQILAPADVDGRADIFALGVILYEMLTARRPFCPTDDPRTLAQRIVHLQPPPLHRPEVPHALGELILRRLLAKDPAARLPSMRDVEQALDTFSTDIARCSDRIPLPAAMVETPPSPPPLHRAPWAMYGIAAVGLLVGALGLAVGLRGDRPAPAPVAQLAPPAPTITVRIAASPAGAQVTFRRRVTPAPQTLQLAPSGIVELVEIAAPGYRTMRYWLTFDRPTTLVAHLVPGTGSFEATEAETRVALGEIVAPVEEAPPAAVAIERTRTLGRTAAAEPLVVVLPRAEEPAPVPVIAPALPPPLDLPDVPSPRDYDAATVSAVVAAHRPVVARCFADGKRANAALHGRLEVQVAVEPSGKIKAVQVHSTLNSPRVAACVARDVSTWRFPARASRELATVRYPFDID